MPQANESPEGRALQELLEDPNVVIEALQAAFREAVRQHQLSGRPMVFGEDGRVILVPANEIAARLGLPTL